MSYSIDINSNYDNIYNDIDEQKLNSYIFDAIESLNPGLVKQKSEGFTF